MPTFYDPEFNDHNHKTWICEHCEAENSEIDAECQFCNPDEEKEVK